MTLNEYLAALEGKSIAVVGYGVSNAPLTKLLIDRGLDVTVCDKRTEDVFEEAAALRKAGVKLRLGEQYLDGLHEDIIFRTPGLHPFTPQLQKAVAGGSVLTSEMEAFFTVCPCRTIAITGSDGKTTTSTIIATLLREAGYTVFLGGNIGTPLLDKVSEMKSEDFAVLELSSFQLHSMKCRPDTAVITNISPNHLTFTRIWTTTSTQSAASSACRTQAAVLFSTPTTLILPLLLPRPAPISAISAGNTR